MQSRILRGAKSGNAPQEGGAWGQGETRTRIPAKLLKDDAALFFSAELALENHEAINGGASPSSANWANTLKIYINFNILF